MNKLLLDTNLLFYAIDTNSAFHAPTLLFIDEVDGELYTTAKNISEFLVSTTRGDNPTLTLKQALDAIEGFQEFISILYPDERSYTRFISLLKQHQARGKKIHDFEIAAIALTNGIDKIATYNIKDFEGISAIEATSPGKF